MWRGKEQKFRLSLTLLALSLLNSCARASCDDISLPQFPHAGEKVAAEAESLSAEEYPNLWEWFARLNKLRQELEN